MIFASKFDILKPCPFCGGEPQVIIEDHPNLDETILAYVTCKKCHVQTTGSLTGRHDGKKYVTLVEAAGHEMNSWNKRTGVNYASFKVANLGNAVAKL